VLARPHLSSQSSARQTKSTTSHPSSLISILTSSHLHSCLPFRFSYQNSVDRLSDLVVRVPGYRAKIYCVSCEVRTEFIYVM
jgi:hypothetical protein